MCHPPNIYPKFGFEWYGQPDADSYIINLSVYAEFPPGNTHEYFPIATNAYMERFECPDSMKYSTKYYWRMKSVNSFGESNWSELWSFYIINKGDDTTVTVMESELYKISVSPNPSSDYIDIQVLENINLDNYTIEIYNTNANLELSYNIESGINRQRIYLNKLSSGAYIIYLKQGNQILNRVKIIKN